MADQDDAQPRQSGTEETQRVLLVTGMLGAGKTTALNVLEDLGWEIVDNLPVSLLAHLVKAPSGSARKLAIGFDSRTRGFVPHDIIKLVDQLAKNREIAISTMFIDCSTGELERRYNETRRPHSMAQGRPLDEGIRAERDLLEPLRSWAEIVVDTSTFSAHDLQEHIRDLFTDTSDGAMTVTVSSFGFARGTPPLADMVFDMRFLDNPHWVPELREFTGLDSAVADHIRCDDAFAPSFQRILDLLVTLLPRYEARGKGYVHVAFGCTGGKHRSVFTAEQIAQGLREAGFSPTVRHRNLGSRTTDAVEGAKR